MMTETKVWLSTAAAVLLLAVAAGAVGSHVLPDIEPRVLRGYESAVDFQFIHGLGLIAVALVADRADRRGFLRVAAAAFVVGILLFCGTLYARAFGLAATAALAPYGGTAFMLGWLAFAIGVWRSERSR
jgi:uncharacterized membrane protein YgdD (TMEM256/DUF423 family)